MEKTLVVGSTVTGNVKIAIGLTDGNLSISGACKDRAGQIHDYLSDLVTDNQIDFAPQWDATRLMKLCGIWKRWHLNDMRAGDFVQMEAIRAGKREIDAIIATQKMPDWYAATSQHLKSLGLYEHDGYKFGHGWKREELPQDVVDFISAILAE